MNDKNVKSVDNVFEALEKLSSLGRKTKTVKIEETSIELSTLDADSETKAFISCSGLEGNAYFYKLRAETVKFSIIKINGKDLYKFSEGLKAEEQEKLKQETIEKIGKIVNSWKEELIMFLYDEWNKLSIEGEKELEILGITQKTAEEQK